MSCGLGVGAELLVFDGQSGEWLARVSEAGKKRMTLTVERQTREPESIPDVWLAFAPVKRAQTDWLVEKATELGAARLLPVMTQRTIAERVKLERLRGDRDRSRRAMRPHAAARDRRAGRRSRQLLELTATGAHALFRRRSAAASAAADAFKPGPALILIGPEGGFTDEERTPIRAAPNAAPISLGPRILRAETAALAALAAYMAIAGDWR